LKFSASCGSLSKCTWVKGRLALVQSLARGSAVTRGPDLLLPDLGFPEVPVLRPEDDPAQPLSRVMCAGLGGEAVVALACAIQQAAAGSLRLPAARRACAELAGEAYDFFPRALLGVVQVVGETTDELAQRCAELLYLGLLSAADSRSSSKLCHPISCPSSFPARTCLSTGARVGCSCRNRRRRRSPRLGIRPPERPR